MGGRKYIMDLIMICPKCLRSLPVMRELEGKTKIDGELDFTCHKCPGYEIINIPK